MTRREPTYLFGGSVAEPYVYTGPDYTDELRDEASAGCVCFDAATAEWAPEPCQACLADAEAWA